MSSSNIDSIEDTFDRVDVLLKHGADPNLKCAEGLPLLHFAAARGDFRLFGLLQQAGARDISVSDICDDIRNHLEMACMLRSVEGWNDHELSEWARLAGEAKTVFDWWRIWQRKNTRGDEIIKGPPNE